MKNKSILILFIFIISSCSSHKKAVIYGALSGSVIGGFAGHTLANSTTPNPESLSTNQKIGLGLGAVTGALLGAWLSHTFYNDNPENRVGPDLFPKKVLQESTPDSAQPQNNLSLNALGLTSKTYLIKNSNELPEYLKKQVYQQMLIEHEIPAQVINQEDGTTLIINGTTATEHRFVKP